MVDLGPVQAERLIRQYLKDGRFMEAMVLAKQAIAEFDPGVTHRLLLAEIYEAQGNTDRAIEMLEDAERVKPGDERVAQMLERLRDAD